MTLFQLLMLGVSAFFAFKIYEHIQTLKESGEEEEEVSGDEPRTAEAFSTFDSTQLIEKADEEREKNNLEKALAIYTEANYKEPNNAETLFKMAYTLALQERDKEALECFLESIAIDDNNPFAYTEMAKIYKKAGDDSNAEMYEQKARELDENI